MKIWSNNGIIFFSPCIIGQIIFIGIFLGISILQLLENGVAAIMKPMTTLHYFLGRRMASLKDEGQFSSQSRNDPQSELTSENNDGQVPKLEKETDRGNFND